MTHEHQSVRERLHALWGHREPEFEVSRDATLAAFARLFAESELAGFDADKRLRVDALSPVYDCETDSRRTPDGEVEKFVVLWTPVWSNTDPETGFRMGSDSTLIGTSPSTAMPQDERTAAMLLLITTPFVHLSGQRTEDSILVQGAYLDESGTYRFLTLDPDLVPSLPAGEVDKPVSGVQ